MSRDELSASDLKLLKQILADGHALEKTWPRFENDAFNELKRSIASCSGAKAESLQRLAFHERNLTIDMSARHLTAVLVPFERLLGTTLRDDEFLVSSIDAPEPIAERIPLKVIADNIRSAFNVGAIFRTSECFGAEEIVLSGYTATPNDLKTLKTSLGTDESVPWRTSIDASTAIREIKAQGYSVIALETAERAENLSDFQWPERCAILLGNERFGIDPSLLKVADHIVRIPMFGKKNSLNVGIALGIALNDRRSQKPFRPIGFFQSQAVNPYDVGRQGSVSLSGETAIVELESGRGFEQALKDLAGFERIWLLYDFHHNSNWKPLVKPPRGPHEKRGVFATRSPYRPNPLGLTCVELVKVEGLKIYVKSHDLLDGTPILDIKPYLPYADAFPDSKIGWLEGIEANAYRVEIGKEAASDMEWLTVRGISQLDSFIRSQLAFDPTDDTRKRVRALDDDIYELAYRTWRAQFRVEEGSKAVTVFKIASGYSSQDLNSRVDKYADKDLHRAFIAR
jgi:tRNA-Thr(GGU) m(6)t(6)A37 methyltransferase TsaA